MYIFNLLGTGFSLRVGFPKTVSHTFRTLTQNMLVEA